MPPKKRGAPTKQPSGRKRQPPQVDLALATAKSAVLSAMVDEAVSTEDQPRTPNPPTTSTTEMLQSMVEPMGDWVEEMVRHDHAQPQPPQEERDDEHQDVVQETVTGMLNSLERTGGPF